ncbi:NmrA family NAD(P)-binding protein [Dactylosporangium sp. NPDC048998]|uniref:NmrA family NAD(P)-binding protein n=1 Tax=Dactylosporangium sp. NPDC048998 TaxID=3363976 RepID=UPI003715DD82
MFRSPATLVLGGSGRTGSLVAKHLADRGARVRTGSRHGSDLLFDWDNPATYTDALAGADRVYLVTPVMRVRYADQVAAFLDRAEAAGVRHVTLLSTYNGDRAPREIDVAAVETDLAGREAFTHSILRPAWVMQNFTDDHLPVINGTLCVPSGGGTEAFVDAADIAAVAAETLLNPDAHAGARYALTGPQAITFDDVAATIAAVSGHPVVYQDLDQETWINGAVAAGVPADYAAMLRWLTGAIIAGTGSTPTNDIETVTGRPPTSFEAFARRAAAWTSEDK